MSLQIRSIDRFSIQGMTSPLRCISDDGQAWWCKGNHAGVRTLRAEWICANIAKDAALPIPDFTIASLDLGLAKIWFPMMGDEWAEEAEAMEANPFLFCSKEVANCKDLAPCDLDLSLSRQNAATMVSIYLFDLFIQNNDRYDGNSNILLSLPDQGIHIIDHNAAFNEGFNLEEFKDHHIFRTAFAMEGSQIYGDFLARLKERTTRSYLESLWRQMPEPWQNEDYPELTLDDVWDKLTDSEGLA